MFDQVSDQESRLTADGLSEGGMLGLWYDSDRLVVEGVYCDEVTAYRARKRWIEAFKIHFLLEEGLDFSLKVRLLRGGKYFKVRCSFLTACGRYAFWRLTHHQALDVQCILETAHLPRPLCSLGVDSILNDVEMQADCDQWQPHLESQPSRRDHHSGMREWDWKRALRRIQGLASRIAEMVR
jgi:hypothetical protein